MVKFFNIFYAIVSVLGLIIFGLLAIDVYPFTGKPSPILGAHSSVGSFILSLTVCVMCLLILLVIYLTNKTKILYDEQENH